MRSLSTVEKYALNSSWLGTYGVGGDVKLMILGNCQAGGLVDLLKLLNPKAEIGSELISNDAAVLEVELRKYANSQKVGLILHG